MSHYVAYYDSQVGSGGVDHVFVGAPYQRGRGIGSFLAGLFRKALPLLKSGARAVGKEAFRAGMNVLDDVSAGDVPFKEALRNRARESGHNLKRKAEEKMDNLMRGSGYKKGGRKKSRQSRPVRRRRNISSKLKKKRLQNKKKDKRKKKKPRKANKKRSLTDIFGP